MTKTSPERLAYIKQYYEEHKEEIKEYKRRYYESRKEGYKTEGRLRYLENKDKIFAVNKLYYDNHKGEIKNYQQKWRDENKNTQKIYGRNWTFKKKYNITVDDYNKMFADQDGMCLGCGRHQDELSRILHVDHNHITGRVRGLLCKDCNNILGFCRDNPYILSNLIDYLIIDIGATSEKN